MNHSNEHLSFAQLADLADNRTPAAVRAPLSAHIEACSHCSGQYRRLEHVLGLMRTDESEDAPRAAIARALNIFQRSPAATPEAAPSLLRRLVASLNFDSFTAQPAFGVRSGAAAARQLVFTAGAVDVDLRITQQAEEFVVTGQLLGAECSGGTVALEGEMAKASAGVNDLCEFSFSRVPAGTYILRLRLRDVEIEILGLELKS